MENQTAWRIVQVFGISIVDAVKLQADGLYTPRDIYEASDDVLERAVGKDVQTVLRKRKPHGKKQEQ